MATNMALLTELGEWSGSHSYKDGAPDGAWASRDSGIRVGRMKYSSWGVWAGCLPSLTPLRVNTKRGSHREGPRAGLERNQADSLLLMPLVVRIAKSASVA